MQLKKITGRIDTQELKAAMQALGFDSRHEKVFSKLQQHQEKSDGRIEFEDFLDCIAANVVRVDLCIFVAVFSRGL